MATELWYRNFNSSLLSKVFSNSLKKADITSVFIKDKNILKTNYTHVSILRSVSKISERCIYGQIKYYFHQIFSKL